MKKLLIPIAAAVFLVAGAAQAQSPTKVSVVMHDPGCHWFSVAGKFQKTLTVNGAAKLVNLDESTLIVKGAGATRHDGVGKTLVLGKGTYTVTMVKQAPDDNHLKLVVR
ncbi:MAG TPA: hypothetical protein VI408_00625 [Gaiellaceae bacterium]